VACGDESVGTGLRVGVAVGRNGGGGADILGRRSCSEALVADFRKESGSIILRRLIYRKTQPDSPYAVLTMRGALPVYPD
jgi:hypothetical protein